MGIFLRLASRRELTLLIFFIGWWTLRDSRRECFFARAMTGCAGSTLWTSWLLLWVRVVQFLFPQASALQPVLELRPRERVHHIGRFQPAAPGLIHAVAHHLQSRDAVGVTIDD